MEDRSFSIDKNEIIVGINKEYGTAKINNLFFPSIEDLIYYVNKLTDIAEELKEAQEDEV